MRVRVLQHVPFEGLGSIEAWLNARRAKVGWTRLFAGDTLPAIDAFDLLVVLGGPMSANDEATLPWLAGETRLIGEAIRRDMPLLGVCLGAQLMARAMGARVYRNPVKEIGWFPVDAVGAPVSGFRLPDRSLAFHWHGETFDLPPGAAQLARSANCEQQAFLVGRRAVGLQFHLETTAAGVRDLVDHCPEDLAGGPFVQSKADLLSAPAGRYTDANRVMDGVLSCLTDGL